MNKRIKRIISNVLPIIILLVGLSVMFYPIISEWWNSKVQTRAVANYQTLVSQMDNSRTQEILSQAKDYNMRLNSLLRPFTDYEEVEGYEETLDISGTGIMGYITIPAINSELVIYHSTSDDVLNVAAGHLQGTSLPVGGKGTHSVISAHRGLPSAKLFSELDKLVVGDTFTVTILDEVLTYQVKDIYIVEPYEIDKLLTVSNKDYLTLMTCTPYGINTHRLLVRSERIDTVYKANVTVTADATLVDSMIIVPFIALPPFLSLMLLWSLKGRRKRQRRKQLKRILLGNTKDGDS